MPPLTYRRVSGSVAWVLQAPTNLHALTSRMHKRGILVGNPESAASKQYLVLDGGKIKERPRAERTPVAPQALTQPVAQPVPAPVMPSASF